MDQTLVNLILINNFFYRFEFKGKLKNLIFYFLGDLEVDKNSLSETFIEDKKNDKKEQIVRMEMLLDKPIKDDLYKYIID